MIAKVERKYFQALANCSLTPQENGLRKLDVFPKLAADAETGTCKNCFPYQYGDQKNSYEPYIALPDVLCNDTNYHFSGPLQSAFQQPWAENAVMFTQFD